MRLTLMILQTKTKEHNPNWLQIPDHPYNWKRNIWPNEFIIQFNKSPTRN